MTDTSIRGMVPASVEVLEEAFRRSGRIRRPIKPLAGQCTVIAPLFGLGAIAMLTFDTPLMPLAMIVAGPALTLGAVARDQLPREALGLRVAALGSIAAGSLGMAWAVVATVAGSGLLGSAW